MEKKLYKIPVFVYFIFVTALIVVLFPREGKFRYTFAEGKQWKYNSLDAPFNFLINKTSSELQREQDSVARSYKPYFLQEKHVADEQIKKFRQDRISRFLEINKIYANYIEECLKTIYNRGIISIPDFDNLNINDYAYFMIINDNIATQHQVSEVFTVQSALSYILENCPVYISIDNLYSIPIGDYLSENLKYDEDITEKIKNDLIKQISTTKGMIPAKTRIIDKNEIVDNKTYNILDSLRQEMENRSRSVQQEAWLLMGVFLLVTIFMTLFYLYMYFFRNKLYENNKAMFFLFSMIVFFTVITELCISRQIINVYVIPYAIIPIVIRTFFDSRTARFSHTVTVLICSLMVPFPFEFIVLQLATGMVAIYSINTLTKRSQLIQCSFYILLTYIVIYISLILLEGDITNMNWKMFMYFGINFVFMMFTYSFIYILERTFRFVSGVTLVEISDISSPILRKLSEVASGTFQHSIQVSILGSAAADKVGASPLLIRTGAMYHDIGKMENPAYFTENQVGDNNPHKHLPYEKSAELVIKHVSDGVKIAKKNSLPNVIVDFIRTHHGLGITKYFYNSYKNEYPDVDINISKFAYPGPNPQTKEEAILMMADAVEAASRSLKDYSENSITGLVNRIIDSQVNDGLLADAPLTFKHIKIIKTVFIEKLINMFHSRITYPELKNKDNIKNEL